MPQNNVGKVVQVIGAVVDIRFEKDNLPNLLNAIGKTRCLSCSMQWISIMTAEG